jgi:hypothetical protein
MPKGIPGRGINKGWFKAGSKLNLGRKHSAETRKKRSLLMTGKKRKPHSEETKEKMRKATLGFKHSEETKKRLSIINKGRVNHSNRDENNYAWKGDKATYSSKHKWITRKLGSPKYCEICKRTDQKKYEWANKDHEYSRKKEDYMRLCIPCHRKYDRPFQQRKSLEFKPV